MVIAIEDLERAHRRNKMGLYPISPSIFKLVQYQKLIERKRNKARILIIIVMEIS